jgi:DNA-binding GntR family transcriptional regulator
VSASNQKQSRFENAAAYIRDKIVRGEFLPGTHLTESSIAAALDISRGPIREALKSLEREGMVNYKANKGYTVVFLSPKEAWEIFLLRGHLEKLALEMTGGTIDFSHRMMMESALDKMEQAQKAGNINKLVAEDDLFHQAIVSSSGIQRLETLWRSLSPLNLSMFYSGKRAAVFDFSDQWEKHVGMYKTLAAGDQEKSIQAVLEHYLVTGKKIFKNLL